MPANRHLLYNLNKIGPEEDLGKWKMTHQILVQTHTKSVDRWKTVKYHETLDANPEGERWLLSALSHNQTFISDILPHDLGKYLYIDAM
jgi:hypothetical protein